MQDEVRQEGMEASRIVAQDVVAPSTRRGFDYEENVGSEISGLHERRVGAVPPSQQSV